MESTRNIAFYKFVTITDPEELKIALLNRAEALKLKGTVLLAQEGINGMLAGQNENVLQFEKDFKTDERFSDILIKVSHSSNIPFKKLLVKVKPEVLTLGISEIKPDGKSGKYISSRELHESLKNKDEVTLIDIRNDFEVQLGTFEGAINPKTKSFTDFVQFAKKLNLDKNKEIVTFCTGGIRCEKAALLLEKEGYKNVRQLHGGILEYFSQIPGGAYFNGDCFVFDERETLDTFLKAKR